MRTPYEKGRRFELKVKRALEAEGWLVIRSAGSKGPADLAAFKEGRVLLLQLKCHKDRPETESVAGFELHYLTKETWRWRLKLLAALS